MNTVELIKKATDLLEEHESAPSAVNLVAAHVLGDDVDICDKVYEMSEGWNDSFRDSLLQLADDSQLRSIILDIESFIIEEELL